MNTHSAEFTSQRTQTALGVLQIRPLAQYDTARTTYHNFGALPGPQTNV